MCNCIGNAAYCWRLQLEADGTDPDDSPYWECPCTCHEDEDEEDDTSDRVEQ